MDITLDRKDSNEALIKITLKEADYQPQVTQKIKDYSRKAQLKGFRPGKVPFGLVKKMYGKSILVDEINNLLNRSITDYIKEQDLRILGDPLPNTEKSSAIDWDFQKEFEFEYEIGLVGDFKYDLSKKRKVTEYAIKVDDKMVSEEVENLRKSYGERVHPEQAEASDILQGTMQHEGLEEPHESSLFIEQVEKKEQKKFVGLKKDGEVTFDLKKAFKEPAYQARLLGMDLEQYESLKDTKVTFTVQEISRMEPAQLNQEFFDKLFGPGQVSTEEELKDKIQEYMSGNFQREADRYLNDSIKDNFVDATKMDLPDAFLKRWLVVSNQGKVSEQDVDQEYPRYAEEMKWNLILNKIAEDHEIKVENEEVVNHAKDMIRAQLASSGIGDQMEDQLDVFADNYLKGEEGQNYLQVFNQVRGDKIMQYIREHISITKKEVNLEQFRKAVSK